MKQRATLVALAFCLSLLGSWAQAVTCAPNQQARNPDNAYTLGAEGTATHTPTGLMWKRCAEGQTWNGSTCSGSASTHTWAQALTLASASQFAGYSDWRLPNLKELRSLMEECRTSPSINDTVFPSASRSYVWSGSPYANDSYSAWVVSFNSGDARNGYRYNGSAVWLVRAGQSFDNLGVAAAPSSVRLGTENLPDGRYQVGAATKAWTFTNGAAAIAGLKAVQVAGKTDAGLGIAASEIALGDMAANASFTVSLPVVPSHDGPAVKASYWKLVDGRNNDVAISNSKTGQFWLKLRTNFAPVFLPTQLDSVGAAVGETVTLPLQLRDADGDALSVTASTGSVSQGVWTGRFATPGVQAVTLTVSDGKESARKTVYVVVRDESGMARSFSDLSPTGTTACNPVTQPDGTGLASDYVNAQYLFLRGVVIGTASGATRQFGPCRYATQAEALKMLMEAVRVRGGLSLDEAPRSLPNLLVNDPVQGVFINASWAAPYVLKAEALGVIADADRFDPMAPATRRFVARAVWRLLGLVVPDLVMTGPVAFSDEALMTNAADLTAAHATAYFGLMGRFDQPFNPDASMVRADLATVAVRILHRPTLGSAQLQGSTTVMVGGVPLPAVSEGQSLKLSGLSGLESLRPMVIGDIVKDEWIDSPSQWVQITAYTAAGTAAGAPVLARTLGSTPLLLPPALAGQPRNTVQALTLLLEDTGSGVKNAYTVRYLVLYPDADGDGVRDDQDLWPTSTLFATDANRNGIPDNADAAFDLANRRGSDPITLNGVQTTVIQALLDGKFQALRDALAASSDTAAPSVPSGLSATAAGPSTIDLAWTAAADNVGVTAYKLYRGDTLVATTAAHVLSYSDTGLAPASTYSYSLAACDAAGNCSARSAVVTARTAQTLLSLTPLSATSNHSMTLKRDGSLWAWGLYGDYWFADGRTINSLVPIQIGTGFQSISAGEVHTVALKTDGSVWAWGLNTNGRVGDSTTTTRLVPQRLNLGTRNTAVAVGKNHSLVLQSDGSLWAWGGNEYGQLGDGTTHDSWVPKQIGTGYVAIAAGGGHSLALKSDGSLWAWGRNAAGQLGNGTRSDSTVPQQIGSGYSAIAAGGWHSVALKSNHSLWAWGYNENGRLGDGSTTDTAVPKQIGIGFYAIAVGAYHTLALQRDGKLWVWGRNDKGQLGDGSQSDSLSPKQIGTGFAAISAGTDHSLAVKYDGSLWAWGSNANGQLGDGTTANSLVPKQVVATGMDYGAGVPTTLDCLFDWAEDGYPAALAPARVATQAISPYVFRYYPGSQSYLGVSSVNNHLYYWSMATQMLDLADAQGWIAQAGCR